MTAIQDRAVSLIQSMQDEQLYDVSRILETRSAAQSSKSAQPVSRRIGGAKGKFKVYSDFDTDNEEIANLLLGGPL